MGSTDSSILVALQKQWEKQERLDRECNEMEKQKEERKRMKEEREQRKERKRMEKCENQQRNRINKAFEKIPRFDGTNPSYCFDWLEQTEALVDEHPRKDLQRRVTTQLWNQHIQDHPRITTRNYQPAHQGCSTTEPLPTSELCHSDQMPTNNYIKSPMRHYKPTT